MKLNTRQKKQLRGLGHQLSPVVYIADDGLKETVIAATDEALNAHELIKVKMRGGTRDENQTLLEQLCAATDCALVSKTGFTVLLYKRNHKKPKFQLVK